MPRDIKNLTKQAGWVTENVTNSDLQISALMRIADASEVMAKNSQIMAQDRVRLEKDLNYYKEGYQTRGQKITDLERSNSALRGVITRLKKQISQQNNLETGAKVNDNSI